MLKSAIAEILAGMILVGTLTVGVSLLANCSCFADPVEDLTPIKTNSRPVLLSTDFVI